MNTISNIGQSMAMDGHQYYNSVAVNGDSTKRIDPQLKVADSARVVDNIVQDMAELKASAQQLQRLSDQVMGHKIQFNVNNELGTVVVKIVDPNTNQVLKEIPSVEMQKIKLNVRRTLGAIFDELV